MRISRKIKYIVSRMSPAVPSIADDFILRYGNRAELMDVSLHEVLQISVMGCGVKDAFTHTGNPPGKTSGEIKSCFQGQFDLPNSPAKTLISDPTTSPLLSKSQSQEFSRVQSVRPASTKKARKSDPSISPSWL